MFFKKSNKSIESDINHLYKIFTPVANRFGYKLSRPVLTVGGKPNIVLLGNHSSGKSSFINSVLGEPAVQDTGVAPTDDGFTVITFGEKDEDIYGVAAIGCLPEEFKVLSSFGPQFLQHLKLKKRNRDYLKKVNLIDSPGMIDTTQSSSTRGYNFTSAVRCFVELSDLVFFLFDPEKPGTTGETVTVLSECLFGMEFKLRILLNKCDALDNMYDFARAYGSLCWNLAKVINSKDIPKIYTTYTPIGTPRLNAKLDLNWFDKYRGEILSVMNDAEKRRTDSIIAAIDADLTGLYVYLKVLTSFSRSLFCFDVRYIVICVLTFVASFLVAKTLFEKLLNTTLVSSGFSWRVFCAWLLTILICASCGVISSIVRHYRRKSFKAQLIENVDKIYNKEFAGEIGFAENGVLRQHWLNIKKTCVNVMTNSKKIPFITCGSIGRLKRILDIELPNLSTKQVRDNS